MGTPALAVKVLESLAAAFDVVAVYTRPDAARGRGKKLVGSPVRQCAEKLGLEVRTPATLSDAVVQAEIAAFEPDFICVAAYGALLPKEVLDIPKYGCLNVHTSLLPRWRGAAPMERAILARDDAAGVCIMKMEEGLDTGAYCKRKEIALDEMYLEELEGRLADIGAEALVEAINEIASGQAKWVEQGDDKTCYAAKIDRGELDLDPREAAASAAAKIRASSDAHPAHAVVAERVVTIIRGHVAKDDVAREWCENLESGQGLFRGKRFLLVTSDGILELDEVKPEGKKAMEARAFAAGVQGIKNMNIQWGRA